VSSTYSHNFTFTSLHNLVSLGPQVVFFKTLISMFIILTISRYTTNSHFTPYIIIPLTIVSKTTSPFPYIKSFLSLQPHNGIYIHSSFYQKKERVPWTFLCFQKKFPNSRVFTKNQHFPLLLSEIIPNHPFYV